MRFHRFRLGLTRQRSSFARSRAVLERLTLAGLMAPGSPTWLFVELSPLCVERDANWRSSSWRLLCRPPLVRPPEAPRPGRNSLETRDLSRTATVPGAISANVISRSRCRFSGRKGWHMSSVGDLSNLIPTCRRPGWTGAATVRGNLAPGKRGLALDAQVCRGGVPQWAGSFIRSNAQNAEYRGFSILIGLSYEIGGATLPGSSR